MFSATPTRLTLACTGCNTAVCTVLLPAVPDDYARLISPLIKIMAMKQRVTIPPDLTALAAANPGAIARFLNVTCPSCAPRPTADALGVWL